MLLTLSQQHTAALAGYAAFLTNILDYVDGYTDAQVHQVCSLLPANDVQGEDCGLIDETDGCADAQGHEVGAVDQEGKLFHVSVPTSAVAGLQPMWCCLPALPSCPQVFAVFSELVAGACRQADEGGAPDAGSGRCAWVVEGSRAGRKGRKEGHVLSSAARSHLTVL